MLHGFAGSSADWKRLGYVDRLDGFHLVLVDERGHGRSRKSTDPVAYGMERRTADVLGVLDSLGLDCVDVVGYSIGAEVAWALLARVPERVRSAAIGGMPPRPDKPEIFDEQIAILEQGLDAAAREWKLTGTALQQFLENDPAALIASMQAIRDWPGIADPSRIATPCLLFCGENDTFAHDGLSRAASRMPNARLEILAGLDHGRTYARGDLVAPLLLDFFTD